MTKAFIKFEMKKYSWALLAGIGSLLLYLLLLMGFFNERVIEYYIYDYVFNVTVDAYPLTIFSIALAIAQHSFGKEEGLIAFPLSSRKILALRLSLGLGLLTVASLVAKLIFLLLAKHFEPVVYAYNLLYKPMGFSDIGFLKGIVIIWSCYLIFSFILNLYGNSVLGMVMAVLIISLPATLNEIFNISDEFLNGYDLFTDLIMGVQNNYNSHFIRTEVYIAYFGVALLLFGLQHFRLASRAMERGNCRLFYNKTVKYMSIAVVAITAVAFLVNIIRGW